MLLNKNSGSISVFLILSIISIMLLGIILFEASRIRAGELMAKRSVDSALASTLAGYDAELKQDYGIFALYEKNSSVWNKSMENYITQNLFNNDASDLKKEDKLIDLYGFKLENVEVNSISKLDKNDVLRSQIIEYMKFRVPIELVNSVTKMFKLMVNTSSRSNKLIKKTELDEELSNFEITKLKLQNQIEMSRRFNKSGYFEELLNNYIESIERKLALADKITSESNNEEIKNLKKKFNAAVKEIDKKLNEINKHIKSFAKINKLALEIAMELLEEFKNTQKKAEEVLGDLDSEDVTFTGNMSANTLKQKEALNKTDIEEMINLVRSSGERIERISEILNDISEEGYNEKIFKNTESIKEAIGYYEIIKLLKEYESTLPSFGNLANSDKSTEKYKNFDARDQVEDFIKSESWVKSKPGEELGKEDDNVLNILNSTNFASANFIKKAFLCISKAGENAKKSTINLRDEIYINEYILKMFKHSTPSANEIKRTSYYKDAEIEFILVGNSKEAFNKNAVKGEILLWRFVSNTIHLYLDPIKNNEALNAAILVSGWTGFGVPLVHTLIMCGWSMGESLIDMKTLINGSKVPLMKTNKDWKLTMGAKGLTNALLDNSEKIIQGTVERIVEKINDYVETTIDNTLDDLFTELVGEVKLSANNSNSNISEISVLEEIKNEVRKIAKEELDKIKVKSKQGANIIIDKEKERIKKLISQKINVYKEKAIKVFADSVNAQNGSTENYTDGKFSFGAENDIISSLILVSYEDYLRLLLLSRNSQTKMDRIKALINMNMRVKRANFNLLECSTALRVKATISSRYILLSNKVVKNLKTEKNVNKNSFELILDKGYK